VVVVGQGPMGLLFSHMFSNLGARNIIAMDKLDYRLEASCKMKATHTVNVDREDAVAAVQKITNGKMADLVVEVVGHGVDTLGFCMNMLRRLGTLLYFGVPDDDTAPHLPMRQFLRQNLTLISSVGPDYVPNFSLARDMIAQGRIDVSPLISHVLPFEEIQKGYELFVDRQDGAIKVVLDYSTLH
jgi:threonine dehydrogenase-like Zn-dependent dehydrogenase